MNNYEFCTQFAVRAKAHAVLDFGCGEGQIIRLLRGAGIDARGCDTFYEGGAYAIPQDLTPFITSMHGNYVPFPDATFDLVINNQVMEHVADLDAALSEIARVLKPGGTVLSLFPDNRMLREGHCGVPLLHRLPPGRARLAYAYAMRRIGFGHFTAGKTPLQWARDFCDWLDRWTYYRPYSEIATAFRRHLGEPHHIEDEWLASRTGARWVPRSVARWITLHFAGMIFICRKPLATQTEQPTVPTSAAQLR